MLKLGSYASMEGRLFCKPCFKKNFFTKGNYSEGFGKLKPQHEFERKTGKGPNAVEGSDSDEEKKQVQRKHQEEEQRRRKEELEKRRQEEKEKDAADDEKESASRATGSKINADEFKKRQAAFLQDASAEKDLAKKKEEERLKSFEEARLRREESLRQRRAEEDNEKKEREAQEKTARENRLSVRASYHSENPFLKRDQSSRVADKPDTTAKTTAAPVKKLTELEEAKETIASLRKELAKKEQEIKELRGQNEELTAKLDEARNSANNNEAVEAAEEISQDA